MKPILALDTETTGLGPMDRAFCASWQLTGYEPGFTDFRNSGPGALIEIVRRTDCPIVCHNASYDYRMLWNAGIEIPIQRLDDTVIRATLINEHEYAYQLEALCQKYLDRTKAKEVYEELAKLFGGRATRNVQMSRISEAPTEVVKPYALVDANLVHDLWHWQEEEIERQGIEDIIRFERSLMPTIIRAEMRGIRVDVNHAERAVRDITKIIDSQTRLLFEAIGKQININSAPQVGALFRPKQQEDGSWQTENGEPLPSTPGGKPSFNADALRDMHNPVADSILEIRSLMKTRDTFLNGHVLGSQIGGRVYPSIHQTKGEDGGTGTGRFSYSGPAMQQIPSRNKAVAAIIKPIFMPDEGQIWVDADMHSFEVRVFAHLVNNRGIIEKYMQDRMLDFHQAVAELTGLVRNATYSGQPNAKQLNLSMIFNSGRGAIAAKMGLDYTWDSFKKQGKLFKYRRAGIEANRIIDHYHEMVPGVKELADRATRKANAFGYVQTQFGRRLRFPRGEKTYKASGLAIQATAADINKENWLLIEDALGDAGRLVLNTHDSYSLSLPEDWKPHWERVKNAVESGFPWFRVPIVLELSGAGKNWWTALQK
jgi:DNA polymerase I-like protein with 3'-5' exonuclease and polymerase domains